MTQPGHKAAANLKERIRQVLNSQSQPTVTVLSSLLALQESLRYIPEEAIEETAQFCGVSINEVWSVVAFYTNFRFKPPGESVVDICWGPACHIKGAQSVLNAALENLDLTGEDESADGRVTLKYNTCLGACAHAPVMAVDHKLEGNITPEGMAERLRQLRGGGKKGGKHA